MRPPRTLAATLALAAALSSSGALRAQAPPALDQRALDQLGPPPGKPDDPAVAKPEAPTVTRQAAPRGAAAEAPGTTQPSGSAAAAHAHPLAPAKATATVRPGPLTVPPAPPPGPVLPPPIVVPARPVPPPEPPPIVEDAPGTASRTPDGLRITFGSDRADLNPADGAALRALARAAPSEATTFTVSAYASGAPDDPSTPRRLSLSRALAVRSVLIAAGIPSVRIYVKALGAVAPDTAAGAPDLPPDRAEVSLATPPAAQTGQSPAPAQKAAQ